jgi:transglycosylase-like protein/peptidase M23-like protein
VRKLLAVVLSALVFCMTFGLQPAAADDLPRPGEMIRHQRWTQAERFAREASAYAAELDSRILCPVPTAEFTSSFGAPRIGHLHQGNDLMAPDGTVIVAPQSGTYRQHGNDSFYLDATDGTQWFGTHLQEHIAPTGPVTAGQPIALVGHTGNADPSAPHLHLERHPGGGPAVDPYPILDQACHGQPIEAARSVPEPVYRYNVLEIERWYEARTNTRISGVTARALTRYLNAIVERAIIRYLQAISIPFEANWDRVAMCESGGDWHINTGNGYLGGLQWLQSTFSAWGGIGRADLASKRDQIIVAERIRQADGLGSWPSCGPRWYG